MPKRKYPKNKQECIICKVEFDNWLTTNSYNPEQEEIVRKSFCRYCPFCKSCQIIKKKGQ